MPCVDEKAQKISIQKTWIAAQPVEKSRYALIKHSYQVFFDANVNFLVRVSCQLM